MQHGQDRLHGLGVEEAADVARLLEQRIHVSADQGRIAFGRLVEADLLGLEAEGFLDLQHVDPLHGSDVADVGHGQRVRMGLGVGYEGRPIGEALVVGPDVDLAEGNLGNGQGHPVGCRVLLDFPRCVQARRIIDVLGDRIAVGRRRHEVGDRRAAAAARFVDHLDADADDLLDGRRHGAADLIGTTAGSVRYDHGNRTLWKAARFVHCHRRHGHSCRENGTE